MKNYPRVVIAGTHSGVGKTTIALGLMSALKRRGLNVQPFKVGPDYIDTSYHSDAAGSISRNLDSWMLSKDAVLELFQRKASQSDISIIEGVMGLYDGKGSGEEGSTAHIARITNSPVILVMDARSMSRSAGAVALGYREFDRKVRLKWVILNNVSSKTHYEYLKDSIEKNTDARVLGFVPKEKNISLPGRHLGLIPAAGRKVSSGFYDSMADLVEKNISIEKVIEICKSAGSLPVFKKNIFKLKPVKEAVTIAVAKDAAFNFYYEDNLDILKHLGANIVTFSPLSSDKLPDNINGVYIGGGFPELYAKRLSQNLSLKEDIRKKSREGMPIYAECGGLMYLMKQLTDFKGRSFPMAGIFPYSAIMGKKMQSMGYVEVSSLKDTIIASKGERARGHVFHWSFLKGKISPSSFSFQLEKSNGAGFYDGLTRNNVLCSYVHFHFGSNLSFAKRYIKISSEYKNNDK